MLSNIRKFSKTFLAKIILIIMVIPFVLWGMGGVFNSGNSNNLVKINNTNISTQDFMNFLNSMNLDQNTIRDNLDQNIIEELTSNLVSKKILEIEIKNLNLSVSEEALANSIMKNPSFQDDGIFSRTKYEKFLLSSNTTASEFEMSLKDNELQKKFFYYIGGGIKSPFFITNKIFKDEQNEIFLNYIDLDKAYIKKENIDDVSIKNFIDENSKNLEEEYIDFTYIKITPKELIGSEEYNETFFEKIDQIENEVLNDKQISQIANDYNLQLISRKNFITDSETEPIEKKIYDSRNIKKEIFDDGNFYVLYQIEKIEKVLPKITDQKFRNKIVDILYQKNKFEFNKNILDQISKNKFTQENFENLSLENSIKIKKITINSVTDIKKFTLDSIKLIYSLPKNAFALVNDNEEKIYLVKIDKIDSKNISKNSNKFDDFTNKGIKKIREQMYFSYDNSLSEKYKVKMNEQTLERVKNYFK